MNKTSVLNRIEESRDLLEQAECLLTGNARHWEDTPPNVDWRRFQIACPITGDTEADIQTFRKECKKIEEDCFPS